MSNYYYRVDATNPEGTAGDSDFLSASSKAEARRAYLESRPEMVEWNTEVTKVTKESVPMADIPVLVLPPVSELVPGADNEDPDHRDEYTVRCNELILEALQASPAERIKAQYPEGTADELILDRNGNVVVVTSENGVA